MNDPVLIERIRDLAPIDMVEKTVFGARCWVLDGNMAFGVHGDQMLVRLGPDADAAELTPFDPMGTGKPMKGWFLVDQELLAEDSDVQVFIEKAVDFTSELPSK